MTDKPRPTFGRKYERRGRHPHSLANLARGREKLRAKPSKRTNSPEHMATMRLAKERKQGEREQNAARDIQGEERPSQPVGAVTSEPELSRPAAPPSPWSDIMPRSAEVYVAPEPETVDSFTVRPVVRRTAPTWELFTQPNGAVTRRRLGSIAVVRVYLAGRGDLWWAHEPDVLLDTDQLDPLPIVDASYDPKAAYAEAVALREREHRLAGRVPTPGWSGTRRSWFHELMDRAV